MRRALAFLTPLGGAAPPDSRTLSWFPVIGAAIGAGVGAVWWLAGRVWPAIVAGGVAVVADLALTGLLHLDGLIDAADGLLPHMTRVRRLEVMAEPTVGAFGVSVGAAALLLRFAAFTAASADVGAIAAIWCASRTLMAVVTRALRYARDEGGLATTMLGRSWVATGGGGVALAAVIAAVAAGWRGEVAVLACLGGGAAVMAFGHRKLGGFTGDVVGAAGVVGETVALLVVAAK
jgi:adenosylcobinamide-GDP ribazoletransferase